MGSGVSESSAESYAARWPVRAGAGGWPVLIRHVVPGAFLAGALFAVMAVTGVGTGPGPLGDCCGYGTGITRDVGATVTEGMLVLQNPGRFPVVLEDIRPMPAVGTEAGLAVRQVEVRDLGQHPWTDAGVGMLEGSGLDLVPSGRRPVRGHVIEPASRVASDRAATEVLVRYQLLAEGTWTYRGYEVTYRSGLVRHRTTFDVTMTACAPQSRFPAGCEAHR